MVDHLAEDCAAAAAFMTDKGIVAILGLLNLRTRPETPLQHAIRLEAHRRGLVWNPAFLQCNSHA